MSGDSLQSVAPRLWDRVAELPDVRGPEERWYGQWEIEVRDPNGHLLVFAERTEGGED